MVPVDLNDLFEQLGGIEPAVGDGFNPLDDTAIAEIETEFGGAIPEICKLYLQQFGAIMFSENVCYQPEWVFPAAYSATNRGLVDVLLGQLSPGFPNARSIDIRHQKRLLGDRLPRGIMPFADNGAGDLICVQLQGESYGKVYLWDHEGRSGTGLYPIAKAVENWLNSLTGSE